jgi:hypothetical protein
MSPNVLGALNCSKGGYDLLRSEGGYLGRCYGYYARLPIDCYGGMTGGFGLPLLAICGCGGFGGFGRDTLANPFMCP